MKKLFLFFIIFSCTYTQGASQRTAIISEVELLEYPGNFLYEQLETPPDIALLNFEGYFFNEENAHSQISNQISMFSLSSFFITPHTKTPQQKKSFPPIVKRARYEPEDNEIEMSEAESDNFQNKKSKQNTPNPQHVIANSAFGISFLQDSLMLFIKEKKQKLLYEYIIKYKGDQQTIKGFVTLQSPEERQSFNIKTLSDGKQQIEFCDNSPARMRLLASIGIFMDNHHLTDLKTTFKTILREKYKPSPPDQLHCKKGKITLDKINNRMFYACPLPHADTDMDKEFIYSASRDSHNKRNIMASSFTEHLNHKNIHKPELTTEVKKQSIDQFYKALRPYLTKKTQSKK